MLALGRRDQDSVVSIFRRMGFRTKRDDPDFIYTMVWPENVDTSV